MSKKILFVLLIIVSIVCYLSGDNIISTYLSSLFLLGALFFEIINDM